MFIMENVFYPLFLPFTNLKSKCQFSFRNYEKNKNFFMLRQNDEKANLP